MLLFAGLFNVAELPFATEELDAGDAGFAALAAVYGLGFVVGRCPGARGGRAAVLKRRFLGGLALVGAGFIACGIAPAFAVAAAAFALAGVGNGLILVYERLLIQTSVAGQRHGAHVRGAGTALTAWAFAVAFVAAGGLIEALGVRTVLVVAGRRGPAGVGLVGRCACATRGTSAAPAAERGTPSD